MRVVGLWPGLASVWYRGSARGLLFSVLFSWCLCLLLLATFVWPMWFAGWLVFMAWCGLAVYWLFEAVRGQFSMATMLETVSPDTSEDFSSAQREYLKGNWFEAEARLLEFAEKQPSDVAAGLLLIGVLRHTGRFRAAMRRLEQLSLLDAASPWLFEIRRERQLIEREMAGDSKPAH